MNITNEIISIIDMDTEFEYIPDIDGPWLQCERKECKDCTLTTSYNDNCHKDTVIQFLKDNNLKPWLFI